MDASPSISSSTSPPLGPPSSTFPHPTASSSTSPSIAGGQEWQNVHGNGDADGQGRYSQVGTPGREGEARRWPPVPARPDFGPRIKLINDYRALRLRLQHAQATQKELKSELEAKRKKESRLRDECNIVLDQIALYKERYPSIKLPNGHVSPPPPAAPPTAQEIDDAPLRSGWMESAANGRSG